MSDSFTKVESSSWGSRLGNALKGIVVGLVLLLVGGVLLFWNEGRAVHRARTLEEGASVVVHVPATVVEPRNDGKLVHVTGRAEASGPVNDPDFGVEAGALALARHVEMYQWVEESHSETRKKLGGGTETVTTFSYSKQWRPDAVDSSRFEKPAGHENPPMPVGSGSWTADRVTLGAFVLDPAFVSQIAVDSPLAPDEGVVRAVAAALDRPAVAAGDAVFVGADVASPAVGDLRIRWETAPEQTVSVVGRQRAGRIEPYQASKGTIALLEPGTRSADAMFQSAKQANVTMTWILRGLGFLLLFFGFQAVFALFSVLADVVPFLGSLVGIGVGIVSFLLAGLVGTSIVALAWLFYRPLLGIALLGVAVVLLVLLIRHGRKAAPAPPPPPPPGA